MEARKTVARWIRELRDGGYILRLLNWRPWDNPGHYPKLLYVAEAHGTREHKVICVRLPRRPYVEVEN